MFTIFAASKQQTYILPFVGNGYCYGYSDAAISKDIRLSIHNGLFPKRCSLSVAGRGKIAFPVLNILIFHYMQQTMENYSVANNSTNTVTSAHETCEKFIAFIRERYPQIQSPHFKISRNGRFLTIRGAFHRRRIFAYGYDFEKVFSYFTKQCLIKMTMDKYYISVAEAKEKKPLEPFFAGIKCRIIQNNKEIISD